MSGGTGCLYRVTLPHCLTRHRHLMPQQQVLHRFCHTGHGTNGSAEALAAAAAAYDEVLPSCISALLHICSWCFAISQVTLGCHRARVLPDYTGVPAADTEVSAEKRRPGEMSRAKRTVPRLKYWALPLEEFYFYRLLHTNFGKSLVFSLNLHIHL